MKSNSCVIEGASLKRTYIHTSKTDYNLILENKCYMLFLVHKKKSFIEIRFEI